MMALRVLIRILSLSTIQIPLCGQDGRLPDQARGWKGIDSVQIKVCPVYGMIRTIMEALMLASLQHYQTDPFLALARQILPLRNTPVKHRSIGRTGGGPSGGRLRRKTWATASRAQPMDTEVKLYQDL